MIQRYNTPIWTDKGIYVYYELEKGESGPYVLYTDHLAAIDEKDTEIERLKERLVDYCVAMGKEDSDG